MTIEVTWRAELGVWQWRVEDVVGFTYTRRGGIRGAKHYLKRLAKRTVVIV